MKTVILAGGRGSRISEESNLKPKPMIQIGKMPIIMHIIKIYEYHGCKEFIICGGYKQNVIKKFFKKHKYNFKVRVINTGIDTMTGGRILKLKNILKKDKNFFLTYGDGVSDVNIKKIYNLHLKKKKLLLYVL
jgi:glucose-1-phosphate cytidylyltransferase